MGDPRTRTDGATVAGRATPTAAAALAACLMLGVGQAAAPQAMVVVTHDDPDGVVLPGQTVQIAATVSWTGAPVFWEIEGSLRASPNLGAASNNRFPYTVFPLQFQVIHPGSASAGSVHDIHVISGDIHWLFWWGGYVPLPPWNQPSGFDVVRFDWTAPEALGVVQFAWEPSTARPQVSLVVPQGNPFIQAVPTTYLGTSLTVIPAPASAAVLGLGILAPERRRRAAGARR